MARPIRFERVRSIQVPQANPQIATTPVPFFQPPLGLDTQSPKNRVDRNHATNINNLWLDRGVMRTRYGTTQVGQPTSNAERVMAVVNFVMGSGLGFVIRVTTRRVELLSGSVWTDISGTVFTGGATDYFTFTSFGDSLLMSNNVDGLWEANPSAGSFQKIDEGPNAYHLTTFAGRVIASGADGIPSRIKWSVKNNSHDWTGIGSGFEDLLSTPGGQIDRQVGVWPISEGLALAVRSNSIWQMTETGNVDLPFRFSRIYDNLGTRSPRSVDSLPGGIVMFGTDDIYVINDRDIQSIGSLVKDRIQSEINDITAVVGVYAPITKEYLLASGGNRVYRYSFQDKGWSKSVYPFGVVALEETIFHQQGLAIDALPGSIDSLPGTIDSLVGSFQEQSFFLGSFDRVMAASPLLFEDDQGPSEVEIITGMVVADDYLKFVTINEVQLEYEFEQEDATQELLLRWSSDGGFTWNPYDSRTIAQTLDGPNLVSFRRTITAKNILLQLRTESLGRLKVIALYPHIFQAGKVHP